MWIIIIIITTYLKNDKRIKLRTIVRIILISRMVIQNQIDNKSYLHSSSENFIDDENQI